MFPERPVDRQLRAATARASGANNYDTGGLPRDTFIARRMRFYGDVAGKWYAARERGETDRR